MLYELYLDFKNCQKNHKPIHLIYQCGHFQLCPWLVPGLQDGHPSFRHHTHRHNSIQWRREEFFKEQKPPSICPRTSPWSGLGPLPSTRPTSCRGIDQKPSKWFIIKFDFFQHHKCKHTPFRQTVFKTFTLFSSRTHINFITFLSFIHILLLFIVF